MLRIFRNLRRRSELEAVMQEELQTHIQARAEHLTASGLSRDEAYRRARIEFGSVDVAREDCRQARGFHLLTTLRRDITHAARLLSKSPGPSFAAILTLALCIGANTAIFSVVDAVLLRPLPYPQPEMLGELTTHVRRDGLDFTMVGHTGQVWEAIRDRTKTLEVAAFGSVPRGVNLVSQRAVAFVQQQRISANFFRVLGVTPLIGREFESGEDRPGGPPVAILSYGLWQTAFAGDPNIDGRSITLKGEPHTVVGVMPAAFQTSAKAELWTPLRPARTGEGGGANYGILARVRTDSSWSAAHAEIQSLNTSAADAVRSSAGPNAELKLVSLQEGLTLDLKTPLLALWAAVALVLLIGCVNIASLLLAKATERKREIATRMALGGGAGVIVRQLLIEALLLAMLGGAAGIVIGYGGLTLLRITLAESLGVWQVIGLDARVLGLTFAIALVTSVIFGLLPALEASRVDVRSALSESDSRGVAGQRRHWTRRMLVLVEVALSMVLLFGATMLVRTFIHLTSLRPGFDTKNVLTGKISLDDARYNETAKIVNLYDETLRRIREIPGVESAAVSLTPPYERTLNLGFSRVDTPGRGAVTNANYMTPELFQTLRIPMIRGRGIEAPDRFETARVAVVNEAFVRRHIRDREAVGTHLRIEGKSIEIVGVVGDVQQRAGSRIAPIPQIYLPVLQMNGQQLRLFHTWFSPVWMIRSRSADPNLPVQIQRAVQSVDSQLPFAGFYWMDAVRSKAMASHQFQAAIVGALAVLALIMAALGVYGLATQSVTERTREFGIRLALGATAQQGMKAVALPVILLASAGVVIGGIFARLSAGLLKKLVFGVSATDPYTIAFAGIGLLAIAIAASYIPAARLTRLNPAETLRHD